jgi:hypothetical protein
MKRRGCATTRRTKASAPVIGYPMRSTDKNGPFFISRMRTSPDHSRDLGQTKSARTVGTLTLTRVAKSRDGEWSADDYDVFEGNQHVGRIILTMKAPQGMPWFWAITARPDSTQNHGYAVSREQAFKEFKARWANPSRF